MQEYSDGGWQVSLVYENDLCPTLVSLKRQEGNRRERTVKKEKRRSDASDNPRIEEQFAHNHHQGEHAREAEHTEDIHGPRQIQSEDFQVPGLKIEKKIIGKWLAGMVRAFGWEVVPKGKTLRDCRL